MNRRFHLPLFVVLCAATVAMAGPRDDLVREILRRVPEWPQAEVEIPLGMYEQYVRELAEGQVPPQPPEVVWLERAGYLLRFGEEKVDIQADFQVVSLPGKGTRAVRLLPPTLAWGDVRLDGQEARLRTGDDRWLYFDAPGAGRYRIAATASVKLERTGDVRRVKFATAPTALATISVDSDAPWDVRFSRCPLTITGTDQGTRGTVGLAPGDEVVVTWQPPRPAVHRAAQIATESHVGWTLADGVHLIRAVLDLRLWGGETAELAVNLPPAADRVQITGPDVREVQVEGTSARVFLRGAVTQRTRLNVSFEVPRAPTGRMALPAFGVVGASHRGGALAVAGGAEGVLLELESPGLEPMALADLPDQTRALLTAPPTYAYRLTGAWSARMDLVGMAEFPVRETLIDSALYTVLYRPDGRVMTKVLYEVRNRAQQYMRVDLPAGATLVVARVAEEQTNLARGEGRTVYVPLERSVLTTAGLVSFPVELVYVMAAPPLDRKGMFRLPLPRVDVPVAYARCALMLPNGMQTHLWRGVLGRTEAWSSETANLEFEYGRGHLTKAPLTTPVKPAKGTVGWAPAPDEPEAMFDFEVSPEESAPSTGEDKPAEKPAKDRAAAPEDPAARILQGKNLYRAGVQAYRRKNYANAGDLFRQVVAVAPKSSEADNARKFLTNVDVALGKGVAKAGDDRSLRATAKAVQMAQQGANITERGRQQELLNRAREALRGGDEAQAEAAYKVAVGLGRKLQTRGEAAQEQKAVVREAEEFLGQREAQRKQEGEKVQELRHELAGLKAQITKAGGREMEQVVEALALEEDVPVRQRTSGGGMGAAGLRPAGQAAQLVPQVEMDDALAEQSIKVMGKSTGRSGFAAGYAYAPAEGRIDALKKQVEQLKAIRGTLSGTGGVVREESAEEHGRAKADAPRFEAGDVTRVPASRDEPGVVPKAPDLGRQVAEKAKGIASQAKEAVQLARQGRLAEAERLVATLEKKAEVTERAARVIAGPSRTAPVPAAPSLLPGETIYLRYPESKAWEDTQTVRRHFAEAVADPAAAPPEAPTRRAYDTVVADKELSDVRKNLSEAREELRTQSKELDRVQFDVSDLTGTRTNLATTDGRRLAEFVGDNYGWAFTGRGQVAANAPTGRSLAPDVDGDGPIDLGNAQVSLQVTGGNLVVANDPVVVERVQEVLERLRLNLGQRVAVASQNVFVGGGDAAGAGIQWQEGANGVRYAVANEGQLLTLMDLEQRRGAALWGRLPPRNAYQEAVVGTQALIVNGAVATVARAADDANTIDYVGNTIQVGHDDYLMVDNGSYVTAVKSGRMQHWSAELEPVRFPGVPAAVVVPAVGHTLKFEKTLLDPSDSLELVADYTWEGEER